MRPTHTWVLHKGKLVPLAEYQTERRVGLQIIRDLAEPFQSPIDGSVISSRKERRLHNERNRCEDVGNDPHFKNPPKPTKEHVSAIPELARHWERQEHGDDG